MRPSQVTSMLAKELVVQALLVEGRSLLLTVSGSSMEPNILDGDLVDVAPIDEISKLKIGDVVLFEEYGVLMLHRVLRIYRKRALLKGDGALLSEGAVAWDLVVGRARSIRRGEREYDLRGLRAGSRARAWAGISHLVDFLFRLLARISWGLGGRGSSALRWVLLFLSRIFRLPLT